MARRRAGWHFLRVRGRSISTGSNVNFAISEAKRFGASGKQLSFALRTIRSRVLEGQRQMFPAGQPYLKSESLNMLNERFGTAQGLKTVLSRVDAERAKARKQKSPAVKRLERPSQVIAGLRPKLAGMLEGVVSFGLDPSIGVRNRVFRNLIGETKRGECRVVCPWLVELGKHALNEAWRSRSYPVHASKADFALRCFGAASTLYTRYGFEKEAVEVMGLSYAESCKLGLASQGTG